MTSAENEPALHEFQIFSSVPILRMFDEEKAKAFYQDYLGFEMEWESRFSPTAPLYCQFRLGETCLQLDGHANEDAPIAQVNIPVRGWESIASTLFPKESNTRSHVLKTHAMSVAIRT